MRVIPFVLGLPLIAYGQLSGTVGPLTDYAAKAKTQVCDITDYGAISDGETDAGGAINEAWAACQNGGLVYIPPGEFAIETCVVLNDGLASAVQLDGTLIRSTTTCDYMISARACTDFEFFSGNSKGAIQGLGYELHGDDVASGPRIFHFQDIANFSVHGLAAVDSPTYYFYFDNCASGEVYNIIVRGTTEFGSTDAFDVSGDNLWFHDIEVSNGDECVTVKTGSTNLLIQSIYCNWSGGCSIGSLGIGTVVENVSYERIYAVNADAAFIKTNNGDGYVKSITWDNVIVHGGAYPLSIDSSWGDDLGSTGVEISDLTFSHWYGTEIDNSRAVIRLDCDPEVPCYDITLRYIDLWTDSGDYVAWSCENVYGSGYCLESSSKTTDLAQFTTVVTQTTVASYSATTMAADLTAAIGYTTSISVPAVPTSFFPGATPSSTLLALSTAGA